jgi:hypothetical protein
MAGCPSGTFFRFVATLPSSPTLNSIIVEPKTSSLEFDSNARLTWQSLDGKLMSSVSNRQIISDEDIDMPALSALASP